LILTGRVDVDGRVVTQLGAKANAEQQQIRVDGVALPRHKLQYFMVNKPTGVVSTHHDPSGRPRVIDLLPPGGARLFTVGRLDMSSEGLILATNDGELANRLAHPRYGVEKTYHVEVAGSLEHEQLLTIRKGVYLAEGFVRPVSVRVKDRLRKSTLLEMVLDEGRNREIRRLLARGGHKVLRLKRVALGPIRLGDLPPGACRTLRHDEVKKLRLAASGTGRRRPIRRPPSPKPVASGSRGRRRG
jgi:23S rRNA pseudouridine2605 synthase